MKTCREWRYSSTFLDLSTRWRWVVSFTLRGNSPRYPLDRRLGGPLSRSGRNVKRKISYPYQESNPSRPARSYTDWAIPVIQEYLNEGDKSILRFRTITKVTLVTRMTTTIIIIRYVLTFRDATPRHSTSFYVILCHVASSRGLRARAPKEWELREWDKPDELKTQSSTPSVRQTYHNDIGWTIWHLKSRKATGSKSMEHLHLLARKFLVTISKTEGLNLEPR
jgi:hypothetical protein